MGAPLRATIISPGAPVLGFVFRCDRPSSDLHHRRRDALEYLDSGSFPLGHAAARLDGARRAVEQAIKVRLRDEDRQQDHGECKQRTDDPVSRRRCGGCAPALIAAGWRG